MASLKAKLASFILDRGDPEGALKFLLGRYTDPFKSASAICSAIGSARRFIVSNDSNRNSDYEGAVAALVEKASSQDKERLQSLIDSSLLIQHGVYMSKKPFLEDKALDKELHQICPCKVVMYRFKAPDEIVEAYRANRNERMQSQHHHQNQDRAAYHLDLQESEKWLETCRKTLLCPVTSVHDYYNVAAALGLVSGRRNYEILKTLTLQPAEHKYQAKVGGIAKQKFQDQHKEYTIPLLCPYEEFERGMMNLRAFRDVTGDCSVISGKYGKGINRATSRLFGRGLNHTQKRNIYVELAYLNKENNGYMTGENSCSKEAWVGAALCHVPAFTSNSAYQAMIVEKSQSNSGDQC